MFGLFVANIFRDFWQNEIGDIFIEITIQKLSLNASEVSLLWYPGISSTPEHFEFDGNKNLVVLQRVVTIDENTQEEIVTFEPEQTIQAVSYYANGTKILVC